MAFQHIQEILDEQEREGHSFNETEELTPPQEIIKNERHFEQPENNMSFAAILKRNKRKESENKPKVLKFVIVDRQAFRFEEEDLEESEDELEYEMDSLEFDSQEDEDDCDFEGRRGKLIVGVRILQVPEEEGKGGMRTLVPKTLPLEENEEGNEVWPTELEEEDALPPKEVEEERIPLETEEEDDQTLKAEEEAKVSLKEEANVSLKEEEKEDTDLTLEMAEEHVLPPLVEKEEGPLPLAEEEENDRTLEGIKEEATVPLEEKEEIKENVLPQEGEVKAGHHKEYEDKEPQKAGNKKDIPRRQIITAPVDTPRMRQPERCGPLKHAGGQTFTFICGDNVEMAEVIGKGGKYTRMARDVHGVTMNVSNDSLRMVTLTGLKRNVEAVYKQVRFRVDRIFDIQELTKISKALFAVGKEDFVMTVPKEFRKAIVGPQETTLRRLVKELDVALNLPIEEDQRDYITICGPLKKALKAERVITAMLNDIKNWPKEKDLQLVSLDFYEFALPFEGRHLLLGPKGQAVEEIRRLYDVQLILPKENDNREVCHLGGDLNNVFKAYQHIQGVLQEVSVRHCDIMTEGLTRTGAGKYRLEIDAQHKGLVVGPNGANVRRIEKTHNVKIIMRKKTEAFVIIQGQLDDVEEACRDIKEILRPTLDRRHSRNLQPRGTDVTEEQIAQKLTKIGNCFYKTVLDWEERAMVIGKGGQNIKRLTSTHNVTFQGPKMDNSDVCTIRGQEEDVLAFFDEVLEIIQNKGHQKKRYFGGQ
ncbi:uncharacterized protein LOC135222563 [Macrobrachium nipponense]|uniref:uncharacterized protein LOC135222563 n=1 Tax=Macrobrachium nipponense TaxID=159736 RepID=UPI0030C861FC